MIILLSVMLVFALLAIGSWTLEQIFKQYITAADDRVKRFEDQLKEQRK